MVRNTDIMPGIGTHVRNESGQLPQVDDRKEAKEPPLAPVGKQNTQKKPNTFPYRPFEIHPVSGETAFVHPTGVEPVTTRTGIWHSIQLNYGCLKYRCKSKPFFLKEKQSV